MLLLSAIFLHHVLRACIGCLAALMLSMPSAQSPALRCLRIAVVLMLMLQTSACMLRYAAAMHGCSVIAFDVNAGHKQFEAQASVLLFK